MNAPPPTDAHDLALWLLRTLSDVRQVSDGQMWAGQLPPEFNYEEVEARLEQTRDIAGVLDERERRIEFYPARANVYPNMGDLLRVVANRKRAPARFTVVEYDFTFQDHNAAGRDVPQPIADYLQAVCLWGVLADLADVANNNLLFISSHNAQVELRPDFEPESLVPLSELHSFAAEFSNLSIHSDQKRAIVRDTLIEQFKPRRSVVLGDVLQAFASIATSAKQSLALYMNEFSIAKIKAEVEKGNLEDTLSLNKTIADMQNQLLGLPVAILLAGATIKVGECFRNYAVLVGVWVFCCFIWVLASNQRNSVDAIKSHVAARKRKVEKMPEDSRGDVLSMFDAINNRVSFQLLTLSAICIVVLVVALLSTVAVYLVSIA